MSMTGYSTNTPRIGKLKGAILKHAVPEEVLGITGTQHNIDKRQSDTVIFRRWLPQGGAATDSTTQNRWSVTANNYLVQEGVTPAAQSIAPVDIPVQLKQYGVLFVYSDKAADLYEDNIPDEMKLQTGQTMGLVREMIRYGALKGCTNKFYAGGSSRATVDEAIGKTILRNVTRTIVGNHGKMVTQILSPSGNYGTSAIEASMLVFVHSDAEHDIRELEGFVKVAEYGNRKPIHPMEIGSVDRYRFIVSPELGAIIDSGATVGTTGLISTGGSNIDIYPFIVCAMDSFGDVALRGMRSFDVNHIPHTQKDKSDPGGQRGYIGAFFWSAMFVQNDGWMAVVEAGVTDLG